MQFVTALYNSCLSYYLFYNLLYIFFAKMAMIDLSFLYEMIHLEQTLPEAQRSQDIESVNLTIFLLYVPIYILVVYIYVCTSSY